MSKTLNETGISYLWNKIKSNFSPISHTHSTSDITTLWDYIKGKADSVYATLSHNHAINDKFIVSEHTTASLSTNASTTASSATLRISKSGYYPLGIVGVNLTGTNYMYVNLFNYYLSAQSNGSGTITYRYRNNSSAKFTGTIEFNVLWVKTT